MKALLSLALLVVVGALVSGCGSSTAAQEVASRSCGPVQYEGKGEPRYLIVSDLPLRAPPGAREQVKGIVYVLRRHGFKAGKFSIGYQSCDDSTAAAGSYDEGRCSANAKAWAADASVIGVIGPYNSGCASVEIPAADNAKPGPLLMIGTATTDPELTTKVAGGSPGAPGSLYPAGIRNFVRLTGPNQYQAAAAALLAKQHHLRRVYVLDDSESYGQDIGDWFERAARMSRVGVAGRGSWNPKAADYTNLVNRVKDADADGVYLAGYAFLHGSIVLKQLREVLGERLFVFAPDGFADPNEDVHEAGSAANGLVFTVAGVPTHDAGPEGKAIVKTTGPEQYAQYGALYGATATHILLDAIARTDGSRRAVIKNVFASSPPAGIIGRFRFDQDGDPTRTGVTVVRIVNGKPAYLPTLYPTVTLAKGRFSP